MLQLSRHADYGVRLLVEVGSQTQGRISTAEVAARQDIPYQFLRKIVQVLAASGLLIGERGLGGGLSLARPAEEINMLDVLRAFGFTGINHCTVSPPRCDKRETCAVYPAWLDVQRAVEGALRKTLLSGLVKRQKAMRRAVEVRASGIALELRKDREGVQDVVS